MESKRGRKIKPGYSEMDIVYPTEIYQRIQAEAKRRGVTADEVVEDLILRGSRHLVPMPNVHLAPLRGTEAEQYGQLITELVKRFLPSTKAN